MNIRNAVHNRTGGIDAEIEHPVHGWIPCTLAADDPDTADLYAAAEPDAAPAPAPVLADVKAAKVREIERAHGRAIRAALGATAHAPGLSGDAAYVDARLAAEGGQDRAALVQRLKDEADEASNAAGAADGKRSHLLAEIAAAADVATVEGITW